MARSLKKGPFCDEHLMKKVVALNEAHKKECEELKKCPYLIDSDGTHHFQP